MATNSSGAADFERIPQDKARRYRLKADHSIVLSRRQFDERFGRLKQKNIATPEAQARIRRETGLIPGPARGHTKEDRKQERDRSRFEPGKIAIEPTGIHQHGRWFTKRFDTFEAAVTFARTLKPEFRCYFSCFGVLRPEYEEDDGGQRERPPEWRTVTLGGTMTNIATLLAVPDRFIQVANT